ncbi:MAG: YtzH-like family protein [Tuberibacillus sp.]
MGINDQHKIGLILDILKTHHLDGVASQSEYEQLYRATKHYLENQANNDYADTLKAVHDYSAQAINLDGYDDHINSNKSNLETWVQSLS